MNKTIFLSAQSASDRLGITLIDGRILSCFLKNEQSRISHRRGDADFNRRLFRENAWLLLENADKILADSRMFLTPLQVGNNLAYIGTAGLEDPTVGVYIEWWLHYPEASRLPEGLIWYFAGSPLSGMNSCSAVTPENEAITVHPRPFRDIWQSFIEVNTRYSEAKLLCEAYTLEELIGELRGGMGRIEERRLRDWQKV